MKRKDSKAVVGWPTKSNARNNNKIILEKKYFRGFNVPSFIRIIT